MGMGRDQRQGVALRAKPNDLSDRDVRKVRVLAEWFTRMHVRQMDFDEGDGDAQQGIVDAIDGAVTNGHADTSDVLQIVEQVLKANNLSLPAKVVGFDPINCTVADCKMLAQAMIGAGKLAEAKVLRDTLDAMIKIAEHAMLNRAAS